VPGEGHFSHSKTLAGSASTAESGPVSPYRVNFVQDLALERTRVASRDREIAAASRTAEARGTHFDEATWNPSTGSAARDIRPDVRRVQRRHQLRDHFRD